MPGKRPAAGRLSEKTWDLLVVGGGITGAGILLEAARRGLDTLLVEQRDFAWGTSSRSSKMVHGGLRYIAQGDIRLTRHALLERERLIRDLPELVVRQPYLFPVHSGQFPGRWAMKAVLWLYDRLAGIRDHRWLRRETVLERAPGLDPHGLRGAMCYTDSLTDDARLVVRTLHEAAAEGGQACNYQKVTGVTRHGDIFHATVQDALDGSEHVIKARRVVNATGAWADRLSGAPGKVRPLRGSHLFIPRERLPIDDCLTVMHPDDKRPVFVFPWEGTTCIGTTDLDHGDDMDWEPRCSTVEVDYLLRLVNSQFPDLALRRADIISTMAGVRPVISSGEGVDPSKERRDHAVWEHDGVVTVSGGKLTTFRLIALDALHAAGLLDDTAHRRAKRSKAPIFRPRSIPVSSGHPLRPWPTVSEGESEIAWMLENEMIVHLDDLMLRRTRLGNLRPDGDAAELDRIGALCREILGWDMERWQSELHRYQSIIRDYYAVPEPDHDG
jgi:glycerol-3-phosphate dehydrogenase